MESDALISLTQQPNRRFEPLMTLGFTSLYTFKTLIKALPRV